MRPNTTDPWHLCAEKALSIHNSDEAIEPPSLHVTKLQSVLPLDDQLGSTEPLTTPEGLREVLFGQPDTGTYAIIEAARFRYLPEILESSELEYRCLFKNAAYDELKDVAPWIVRLDEKHSLTRNLLTRSDAYWHLWDDEPALYLRSRASLAELWQHLRKFTRIQDQRGQWFYFRFWEPKWTTALVTAMAEADQARFMARIDGIIVLQNNGSAELLSHSASQGTEEVL